MKRCTKCGLKKSLTEFYARTDNGQPKSACKPCEREKRATYVDGNKEAIRIRRVLNASKYRRYNKRYYEAHKEQHAATMRVYTQNRTKSDPNFKLLRNLRTRLYNALKRNFYVDQSFDPGCSINELKNYLESKFQPGMSWDNWSREGWHIDHIKPLRAFDLTDPNQLKEAVHYTNLQPLWAKDNLHKSGKV